MLTDQEIHDWMDEGQNRSLFTDDEIDVLLIALMAANEEYTLDDAHMFLNWCVRQVVGGTLVSLIQKGVIQPILTPGEDEGLAFRPHPDLNIESVSDLL